MGAPSLIVSDLEPRTVEIGRELLMHVEGRGNGGWSEGLLDRIMDEDAFRVQLLRFVDVLPALDDDAELVRHLREYLGDHELPLPALVGLGLRAATGTGGRLLAPVVRKTVAHLARRFIGGADIAEALGTARKLWSHGRAVSLDLLGEATVSEAEALAYQRRYLQLLGEAPGQIARWPETSAPLGKAGLHVSLKVSSLYSQTQPADFEGSVAAVSDRLRPIFLAARDGAAAVCLDMEHFELRDITLACLQRVLVEPSLQAWADGGIALQAYLVDTDTTVAELTAWARARGAPITVRLVRGAYWDQETITAAAYGWTPPVWPGKMQTDACYERCLDALFHAYPDVRVAVATHNVRSIARALVLAEITGRRPGEFEFQMLYGMAPHLENALVERGQKVRVYLPFGELLPGMAYLVRRLLENTSSQSFQHLRQREPASVEALLASPHIEAAICAAADTTASPGIFNNTPVYRFTEAVERTRVRAALAAARSGPYTEHALRIDGAAVVSTEYLVSVNPAHPGETVGRVCKAGAEHVERAVAGATRALAAWSALAMDTRADCLCTAAIELRRRRDEFAACEILEAGKSWSEADADVTEAIDYLEYYAEAARRLGAGHIMNVPGETNALGYRPRGVGVIIPPWNFPLAILVGMLSAAIVTGNTAILKPSSQTPVIAARLVDLLHDAGLPPGVVQFLPGGGGVIGDFLVQHPGIHFIAFTGSLEIGARIVRLAAEIRHGQHHVKHVIAEMGGKNAIIVDGDADLDDAVRGVVHSAFSYQGQKCSACSRVIVVGSHYQRFLNRLTEATASLRIGPPEDPANFLGPVIEESARDRIRAIIEAAKHYARVAYQMDSSHLADGWYVGPAVFSEVPPHSPLAQEEIFGPVLAVMRASNLDEALRLANGTPYALTGGLYSRSPANIARVKREFECGNLYINRKITGALVGRQPFGGFKLSGLGSKAGGPDYLLHFVVPRTVTENTLRRGFAPPSS
ncbi:MAG: proline dehydrogenase family protein [Chromatiales bacterium]